MAHKHLDVKLPTKDAENGLMKVIKILKPSWNKEDLSIKLLSGGFINKMYGVSLKSDSDMDDGLVIRINSECTLGLGADRDAELRTLLGLNSRGMGVTVIASFNNGLVFEFVKGQPLSTEQVRDKHITSLVAIELARMHVKLPLETDPRSDPLILTRTVFNHVPETVGDPQMQAKYVSNIPYAELRSEFHALHKYLSEQNMDKVICHGDLWQGNIMHNQETDKLTFVDFEQTGYGFEAWDLAFFLVCQAGTPPDYKNHFPTPEDEKHFIETYLREKLKVLGADQNTFDGKYKQLYCDVRKCQLLAFLHLVNQCLYDIILTADIVVEDFDFMGMATDAWKEYKQRKDAYMKMTPEDVTV